MFRLILIFILMTGGFAFGQSGPLINEMMSDNETTIKDDQGDYEDWIEIFNPGDSEILMDGYYLSDDPGDPLKWEFPPLQIEPGGFLLVFASGRDTVVETYIHTSFKIDANGEWLGLSKSGEELIDSFPPVDLEDDISYGRRPDGSETFFHFDMPTPGGSNNFSSSLFFSKSPGFYTEPFQLAITTDNPNAVLHYSRDGSEPGPGDEVYAGPLWFGYRFDDPNVVSLIPTTPDSAHNDQYHWKPPTGNVEKVHVLRVRPFVDNMPSGKTYSMTFLVDSAAFELYPFPIMSIIADPDDFFSNETGIYVPGNTWNPDDPQWTGNYFQEGSEWERPVHLELFNESGGLDLHQDAGARIHGKSSRRRPQKSLKFTARAEYGNKKFKAALFPERDAEEYEGFILKNTFGDQYGTIIKDALTHRLVKPLGIEVSDSRPVVVFINGEYWGFQDLREHQDENYLDALFDIDKDSLTVLENWGNPLQGSNVGYLELLSFIEQNDITDPVNYEVVTSIIDIGNYIDYQISEIYLNNYDWPGSNIEFWQAPDQYEKWRWIFFDLDFAWGNPEFNMLEHATAEGGTEWPNPDWSTFLLRNLLKNDAFRTQFVDRFAELLKTTFQRSAVISLLDEFKATYDPEIDRHIQRYRYPASHQAWLNAVSFHLEKFAHDRPCYMEDQVIDFFNLDEFDFDCDSNSTGDNQGNYPFLSPNPTDGILYLRTAETGNADIVIYDCTGRRVFREEIYFSGASSESELNLRHLPNGMYLIQVSSPGSSGIHKLIISK